MYVCVSVHLSVSVYMSLSVTMSVCPCVRVSVCLSVAVIAAVVFGPWCMDGASLIVCYDAIIEVSPLDKTAIVRQ